MRTIRYHPKVPAEVREILAYYEGISAALADEFWSELGEALRYAQEHPKRTTLIPAADGEAICVFSPTTSFSAFLIPR